MYSLGITDCCTYRGRGEIGGVYLPAQLERTPQLCLKCTQEVVIASCYTLC